MTDEKHKELMKRLDALERLILTPARRHSGGPDKPHIIKHTKKKIQKRGRLDSL